MNTFWILMEQIELFVIYLVIGIYHRGSAGDVDGWSKTDFSEWEREI